MPGPDDVVEQEPLVQPRVIRFLRNRKRIVDYGLREDFLTEVERNVVQRRVPDNAAEEVVQRVFNRLGDVGGTVAKDKTKKKMEKANRTILNNV